MKYMRRALCALLAALAICLASLAENGQPPQEIGPAQEQFEESSEPDGEPAAEAPEASPTPEADDPPEAPAGPSEAPDASPAPEANEIAETDPPEAPEASPAPDMGEGGAPPEAAWHDRLALRCSGAPNLVYLYDAASDCSVAQEPEFSETFVYLTNNGDAESAPLTLSIDSLEKTDERGGFRVACAPAVEGAFTLAPGETKLLATLTYRAVQGPVGGQPAERGALSIVIAVDLASDSG